MNTILRLFYDLTTYRRLISDSFIKNLGRFLLAYVILACGYAWYANANIFPDFLRHINNISTTLNQALPPNATFTMNNYHLTTNNLSHPFSVKNYLYIDTSATTSALASSSAAITLDNTQIRITSPINTHEVYSYQDLELPDFTYTGSQIKSHLTSLDQRLTQIQPYLPFIAVIPIYFILVIARLFHVIFYCLIFTLIISIFRGGYRFGDILKITLHTIIVAETLNLAILVVYHTTYNTIFSVAFIGVSILAYLSLPVRIQLPPQTQA